MSASWVWARAAYPRNFMLRTSKACKLSVGRIAGEIEMKTDNLVSSARRWTAIELRRPSQEERDAILEAAAALAAEEYRSNPELTAWSCQQPMKILLGENPQHVAGGLPRIQKR